MFMLRDINGLPPVPTEPSGYEAWKRLVLLHRLKVLRECHASNAKHREHRQREVGLCQQDRLYLANVYGTIYEGRDGVYEEGTGGYLPFVMYPFQVEVWNWLDARMKGRGNNGDGLIVKSREMGLSNISVMWAGSKWLIDSPFQCRVASRVADLVDKTGDPDSLFWKLDTFLQGMPSWLLQAFAPGFDWKHHRISMQIRNPRNGNTIKGESTTANLGRGGRASVILYDEAAFMPNFGVIWTAGRASSPHRIAISTVNIDEGMDFHDIHKGKNGHRAPAILEIPWNAHPHHTQAWFEEEMKRDTLEGIKREVLMDYFAGTGEWVYPDAQKKEVGDFPYEPYAGPIFGAFDDGFDDEWFMHLIQYNMKTGRHRVIESYWNKHKKVDFYGSLMTGVPRSDLAWGDNEIAFVKMVNMLPGITWIGDPHAANREQIAGMSVIDHLAQNYNIHVMYDMSKRGDVERRVALSHLIPLLDFNATDRVMYALDNLKRNRFPKQKSGSDQQNEAKKAIHDETSHATTAFEWYAVNFEQFRQILSQPMSWEGPLNE